MRQSPLQAGESECFDEMFSIKVERIFRHDKINEEYWGKRIKDARLDSCFFKE